MKPPLYTVWMVLFALMLTAESKGILMSYSFVQGGYADGATLSGSFTGEDLNGDGVLVGFLATAGEVPSFGAGYSGSSAVPAFSVLDAFYSVTFNLNTLSLSFSETTTGFGIVPFGAFQFASVQLGRVSVMQNGIEHVDTSTAPVIISRDGQPITPVPETVATWALLSTALLALGLLHFRMRTSPSPEPARVIERKR
jgi:hypothetical protein